MRRFPLPLVLGPAEEAEPKVPSARARARARARAQPRACSLLGRAALAALELSERALEVARHALH